MGYITDVVITFTVISETHFDLYFVRVLLPIQQFNNFIFPFPFYKFQFVYLKKRSERFKLIKMAPGRIDFFSNSRLKRKPRAGPCAIYKDERERERGGGGKKECVYVSIRPEAEEGGKVESEREEKRLICSIYIRDWEEGGEELKKKEDGKIDITQTGRVRQTDRQRDQ